MMGYQVTNAATKKIGMIACTREHVFLACHFFLSSKVSNPVIDFAAAAAAATCKATAGGHHETTLPLTPAMSNCGD